jgi:hypothetical protein
MHCFIARIYLQFIGREKLGKTRLYLTRLLKKKLGFKLLEHLLIFKLRGVLNYV